MPLVLSLSHGRRCIVHSRHCSRHFLFSMVHVCLLVRRRRRYLCSCRCRWCFSHFGAAGFLFIRSVVAAGFSHTGRRCFLRLDAAGGVFISFLCRRNFVSLQLAFLLNAALPGPPAISVAAFTSSRIGKASITTTIRTSIITLLHIVRIQHHHYHYDQHP